MREPDNSLQRRSPWILVSVSTVIVASLVLAVSLASRFGVDPNYVASAVIDRKVPPLELPRLGAEGSISLHEAGGDILVVNFWASWCPACRAEHDDLILAASRYETFGVRFVGVVYQDRESSAIAFLDELGWGYEYATDPGSRAAIAFGLRGVPETYFVDRDGVITARISGETNITALSTMLDAMLLEPITQPQDNPVPSGNTGPGDADPPEEGNE